MNQPTRDAADVEHTETDIPEQRMSGDKLHKVLAQAGFGSRRLMEAWISAGRITVNGETAVLGMRVVEGDLVKTGHRTIRIGEASKPVRVLLYHKPEGEIVSRDDPGKRQSVFDKLPKLRGEKWIAIGRLDFNTSGLLIFTTSGELANRLMHPRFEIEREYAVRTQGIMTEPQIVQALKQGVTLEDGLVHFEKLEDKGGEGFNHWYQVVLKEGRNRIVRRTFDALGLPVSRLLRIRFGLINLPPRLKRGMTAELGVGEVAQVLEWVGITLASEPVNVHTPAPSRTARRSPDKSAQGIVDAKKPQRGNQRRMGNRKSGAQR